jgi:hypothetical protein
VYDCGCRLDGGAEDPVNKALLLAKIDSAKHDIEAAETDLEKALRDMQVMPRAEKTTISKALEDAFAKVRATRALLTDLQELVSAGD